MQEGGAGGGSTPIFQSGLQTDGRYLAVEFVIWGPWGVGEWGLQITSVRASVLGSYGPSGCAEAPALRFPK